MSQVTDQIVERRDEADDPDGDVIVEIRRNAALSAAVGAVASVVGIAYLARAVESGAVLDWVLFAAMAALAVVHLLMAVDARIPLLVADRQGVRVRRGRTWRGMTWPALERVEHRRRRGLLRDGRLVLVPNDDTGCTVPLSMSTRVVGHRGDLTAALAALAGDAAEVVEVDGRRRAAPPSAEAAAAEPAEASPVPAPLSEGATRPEVPPVEVPAPRHESTGSSAYQPIDQPEGRRRSDPRPALARGIGVLSARLSRRPTDDATDDSDGREARDDTPIPLRDPVVAARAEIRRDDTVGATALRLEEADTQADRSLPEIRELRRTGSVSLVEDPALWSDRVQPISRGGSAMAPAIPDGLAVESAVEPAEDPVIGPELAAARTRLGLTVDQLADRTRIRPHVIESIEVDDFAPCGGDFYARGHLRTLARVVGIDVTPLLTTYDERYADAPIDPRRVFEAELATGGQGAIRGTRGGPNWSVLIAAVMTLVLAWSIARLIMDNPVELSSSPRLNGSAGLTSGSTRLGDPVPVVVTAAGGGAHVVVKGADGKLAFEGDLAFGESRTIEKVVPAVTVQSSDGSVVVTVDGDERGAVGETGQPAREAFPAE